MIDSARIESLRSEERGAVISTQNSTTAPIARPWWCDKPFFSSYLHGNLGGMAAEQKPLLCDRAQGDNPSKRNIQDIY